jgi:phosphosulfolactate synthase
LIQQFGPDVNLGNIPTGEVLALEALRAGLRFETFYRIAEELERTGQWHPDAVEKLESPEIVSAISPQNSEQRGSRQ